METDYIVVRTGVPDLHFSFGFPVKEMDNMGANPFRLAEVCFLLRVYSTRGPEPWVHK